MSADWKTYVLPEKPVLDPAQGLPAFLAGNSKHAVQLDARGLGKIDTLLVQYLVAAARVWADRNLGFRVMGVAPALSADFARIGLTADHLTWQGDLA